MEESASGVYRNLSIKARVILRLLDHARHAAEGEQFFGLAWKDVHDVFSSHYDNVDWAIFDALEELELFQIGCLIPGQHLNRKVLFATTRANRPMLQSRVLYDPDKIRVAMVPDKIVDLAMQTLQGNVAA